MAAENSALKRKALSDRTNIITDPAAACHRKSSSKSTVAHSRGKSSVQVPSASLKSNTSTGSAATTASSVRSSASPLNRSSRPQTRSNDDYLPKSQPSAIHDERHNSQAGEDKSKAVREKSHPSAPSSQQISSSAPSDDLTKSRPSSIQNESQNNQIRKDKGKAPIVDFTTEVSHPSSGEKLLSGAIAALRRPSIPDERQNHQVRKDKRKAGIADFTIETSDPSTPSCQKHSSAASGTISPLVSRFQTTWTRRKAPQSSNKHGEKTKEISSCPARNRLRDLGDQLSDKSRDGSSGIHTNPGLGLKKRSRSRRKNSPLHAMPKEEVEKLKSYFADIDAFELPVEEAGDSDLD